MAGSAQHSLPESPTALLSLWGDETWGHIQIQSNISTIGLIAHLPALRRLSLRVQGGLGIQWNWTSLCWEVEWHVWCSPCSGLTSRSWWSPSAALHSIPLLPLRGSDHRICTVSYKSPPVTSDLECWALKWATMRSPLSHFSSMIATSWEPDFEAGSTSKRHFMLNAKGVWT